MNRQIYKTIVFRLAKPLFCSDTQASETENLESVYTVLEKGNKMLANFNARAPKLSFGGEPNLENFLTTRGLRVATNILQTEKSNQRKFSNPLSHKSLLLSILCEGLSLNLN